MDLTSWILFAQEAAGGGGGAGGGGAGGGLLSLLPMIVGMVLLYIFLIQRPQKQEQMRRRQMLENLKKNDHVITSGGIYGVVTNIRSDGDEISIRVDDTNNTRLRVSRSAIARVIGDEGTDVKDKDTSKESA